jgi:hypothetical protein
MHVSDLATGEKKSAHGVVNDANAAQTPPPALVPPAPRITTAASRPHAASP